MSVTAVLTHYRRPYTLSEQVTALRRQSVPVEQVWMWVNSPDGRRPATPDINGIDRTCWSDHNWKFFPRFALALLAETEYVAILDDDAIPGSRWFENCLNIMDCSPAVLGTAGVRFTRPAYDEEVEKHGWIRPTDTPTMVDFVGQSWFMRTEWLPYLWRERPQNLENCEDMYIAYVVQKYLGLPSICPPHPVGEPALHGSLRGSDYDGDANASSIGDPLFWEQRRAAMEHYVGRGWRVADW